MRRQGAAYVTHELSDTDAPQLFTVPSPEALAAAFGGLGIGIGAREGVACPAGSTRRTLVAQ